MKTDTFSVALEKSSKRLREECVFKYKTIEVRGEPYSVFIPEKRMVRILNFKGTGEKRKFYDLVKEVEQMFFDEFLRTLTINEAEFDPKNAPWLDEYIIQKNFQVIFEIDDIIVRKRI